MTALDFKQFHDRLDNVLDHIVKDNETVVVTRQNNKNVVVMSLDAYNELMEDIYDASAAEEAYEEYVNDGKKSRPISELWKNLDL